MLDLAVQHIRTLQDQVQVSDQNDQPYCFAALPKLLILYVPYTLQRNSQCVGLDPPKAISTTILARATYLVFSHEFTPNRTI